MGVDIHYLTKSTKIVVIDGQEQTVGQYKFLSRYSDFDDIQRGYFSDFLNSYGRMLKARIAKIERGWELAQMPEYVVTTDFKEEALVYRRDTSADTFWVDTRNPGEVVGMLTRKGRRWVVVPEYKCWHCKDTGVAKCHMSCGDKTWVEGMVCSCNPAGDKAAKERFAADKKEHDARNDRLAWERGMVAGQKASLDSCCL